MWLVLYMLYFFLFSINKIVPPADADNIPNLAQHPKSLETAHLMHSWPHDLPKVISTANTNL